MCLYKKKKFVANSPFSYSANINQGIEHAFHNSVLFKMEPFLASNPVNRQCPDNPHFHEFNRIPVTYVSAVNFFCHALRSFVFAAPVMSSLLVLNAAIARVPDVLLTHMFLHLISYFR
jgi:hypothetical protein